MSISNTMMNDIFSKIAIESRTLTRYSKIDTLTPETIQAATKLNLPGELGKHAISEGRNRGQEKQGTLLLSLSSVSLFLKLI